MVLNPAAGIKYSWWYYIQVLVLNAAAGIFVGGKADSIKEGIGIAREVISSGVAMNVLQELAAVK